MKLDRFVDWALDPKRTDEQAFFAELVVEWGYSIYCGKHKIDERPSYEEKQKLQRERRLNPAHRKKLKRKEVEAAVEALATREDLSVGGYGERPVRDLTGLQFFTHLRDLQLGKSEVADFSVLADLKNLEKLHFSDDLIEDLRPVSALKKLKDLWATVREPWPLVEGWGTLQKLETFRWHGNLLVLEGLGAFPQMRDAHLNNVSSGLPLRDATRLPDMPALEILEVAGIRRLDGLERYPLVKQLSVHGPFRDLQPLTAVPAVTHLEIRADKLVDLTPLCSLPELRKFQLWSFQPMDLFALTDAPKLHEVETHLCDANERDVVALRELLSPWDKEFLLTTARPLPAMRFKVYWRDKPRSEKLVHLDHTGDWGGNRAMQESENKWLGARVPMMLDRVYGDETWGIGQHGFLFIHSLEVAERLPEFIDHVRRILAQCRHPHSVTVQVQLKPGWRVGKREDDDDEPPTAEELAEWERAEREDTEARWKEEAELRERELRLQQLRQRGVKVNPADFAPAPEPPDLEDTGDDDEEDDDRGDEHPQAEEYWMAGFIREDSFIVYDHSLEVAERLMGRKAERQ